jgi:hypothetical protein
MSRFLLVMMVAGISLAAAPPTCKLGALSAREIAAAKARGDGRAVMGTHRDVSGCAVKKGKWQKQAGAGSKWIWQVQVKSTGASGLRVHFASFDAGQQGSVVRVTGDGSAGYRGKGPDGNGEFWSGLVNGDTAVIEFTAAEKVKRVPFIVDKISHLF